MTLILDLRMKYNNGDWRESSLTGEQALRGALIEKRTSQSHKFYAMALHKLAKKMSDLDTILRSLKVE